MDEPEIMMKEINPADPPIPLTEAAKDEIAALALRQRRANGVLMRGINYVGGQVEDGLRMLPAGARGQPDASRGACRRQSRRLRWR